MRPGKELHNACHVGTARRPLRELNLPSTLGGKNVVNIVMFPNLMNQAFAAMENGIGNRGTADEKDEVLHAQIVRRQAASQSHTLHLEP